MPPSRVRGIDRMNRLDIGSGSPDSSLAGKELGIRNYQREEAPWEYWGVLPAPGRASGDELLTSRRSSAVALPERMPATSERRPCKSSGFALPTGGATFCRRAPRGLPRSAIVMYGSANDLRLGHNCVHGTSRPTRPSAGNPPQSTQLPPRADNSEFRIPNSEFCPTSGQRAPTSTKN